MQNEKKYFSVSVNGKWTKDSAPVSFYTDRGAEVKPSRLNGNMSVFIGGVLVASLFENQSEQKTFLIINGLI